MTDEKLLEKIEQIVDNRVSQTDNKIEALEIKMEHRFISVKKEMKAIRKQQDQDREDWSNFFHEVGIFIEEVRKKLMQRIERIETHLGFSKN